MTKVGRTGDKLAKKSNKKTTKPKTSAPKHPWRLAFSILLMMIWVASSVIASQLVVGWLMTLIIGAETLTKPVPMAVYSALSYSLALFMVVVIPGNSSFTWKVKTHEGGKEHKGGVKGKATNHKALGLSGWPTWTDIGLAPVGFVVYYILAAILVSLFSLFPWFDVSEVQNIGFSYYVGGFDRVIAFITLVVVAPIAEEVIFRGWLYGKIREKIAAEYSNVVSMIVSIFLVSLLFGLVHFQWNVGVNVFALSIVLCGLREITGTIYAGILLHMLKNGVAFWLLFMM